MFLSTGPGALTALGALQEAHAMGVLLLVITSQVPRDGLCLRARGMLHQLDDQQRSATNVTKSTARRPQGAPRIPSPLADAFGLWPSRRLPAPPGWRFPQDVLARRYGRATGSPR